MNFDVFNVVDGLNDNEVLELYESEIFNNEDNEYISYCLCYGNAYAQWGNASSGHCRVLQVNSLYTYERCNAWCRNSGGTYEGSDSWCHCERYNQEAGKYGYFYECPI